MARRTKEDAQKTRATIMKAATELFYENGVTQTSLQKIAVKAGVTRGAIYWHFRDKVDVLHAIADENFLPNEELLEQLSFQELDNPIETMREITNERMDDAIHDPIRRRVFTILMQRCEYIEEMHTLVERHRECHDRMFSRLSRIYEQAQKKGKLAEIWSPSTAAYVTQHFFRGVIDEEMEHSSPSKARDKERHIAMDALYDSLSA